MAGGPARPGGHEPHAQPSCSRRSQHAGRGGFASAGSWSLANVPYEVKTCWKPHVLGSLMFAPVGPWSYQPSPRPSRVKVLGADHSIPKSRGALADRQPAPQGSRQCKAGGRGPRVMHRGSGRDEMTGGPGRGGGQGLHTALLFLHWQDVLIGCLFFLYAFYGEVCLEGKESGVNKTTVS